MCIIGERVKELLEANNAQLERTRSAQHEAELLRSTLRAVQELNVRLEKALRDVVAELEDDRRQRKSEILLEIAHHALGM